MAVYTSGRDALSSCSPHISLHNTLTCVVLHAHHILLHFAFAYSSNEFLFEFYTSQQIKIANFHFYVSSNSISAVIRKAIFSAEAYDVRVRVWQAIVIQMFSYFCSACNS